MGLLSSQFSLTYLILPLSTYYKNDSPAKGILITCPPAWYWSAFNFNWGNFMCSSVVLICPIRPGKTTSSTMTSSSPVQVMSVKVRATLKIEK